MEDDIVPANPLVGTSIPLRDQDLLNRDYTHSNDYLQIPFVATIPYDFGCFASFPARHGFFTNGNLDLSRSATELASAMQSWLYFGLIAHITSTDIDLADFEVKSNDQKPIVHAS